MDDDRPESTEKSLGRIEDNDPDKKPLKELLFKKTKTYETDSDYVEDFCSRIISDTQWRDGDIPVFHLAVMMAAEGNSYDAVIQEIWNRCKCEVRGPKNPPLSTFNNRLDAWLGIFEIWMTGKFKLLSYGITAPSVKLKFIGSNYTDGRIKIEDFKDYIKRQGKKLKSPFRLPVRFLRDEQEDSIVNSLNIPDDATNYFVRVHGGFFIRYQDKEMLTPYLQRLDYVYNLILWPKKDFKYTELFEMVTGEQLTITDGMKEKQLDPKSKKEFTETLKQIESVRVQARKEGRKDEIEKIDEEILGVESVLNKEYGAYVKRSGNKIQITERNKLSIDLERKKRSVSKQIKDAIAQLEKDKPFEELAAHLTRSINYGSTSVVYNPDQYHPEWKTSIRG